MIFSKLEGLKVINGKNDAGKTTVGKVQYSLIQSCAHMDKAY